MKIDWPWRKVERGVHERCQDREEKLERILSEMNQKVSALGERVSQLEDQLGQCAQVEEIDFVNSRVEAVEERQYELISRRSRVRLPKIPAWLVPSRSTMLLVVALTLAMICAGGLFWLLAYQH